MAKIYERFIDRFDGGMTNKIRSGNFRLSRVVRNFDIVSDPNRMAPYRDMTVATFEAGITPANSQLDGFLAAVADSAVGGSGTIQYARGTNTAGNSAVIYRKQNPAGTLWEAIGTGIASTPSGNLFIAYQGLLYWANVATNLVIQALTLSAGSYNGTVQTVATLPASGSLDVAQGIVHSKDDILYIPYITVTSGQVASSFIASLNASTWSNTALTLIQNMIPIPLAEYGNYLAIGMKPRNMQNENSVVLLWDRGANSVDNIHEEIDWGKEQLELVEEIDGVLVGISTFASASGGNAGAFTFSPKIVFKYWTPGMSRARQFLEIPLTASVINNNNALFWKKLKINNRILWSMSVEIDSVRYDGIWALSRNPDSTFSVSIDRLFNNDTAITNAIPRGFIQFGDYMTVSYTADGTYVVNSTGGATFTSATSTYQTIKIGNAVRNHKLIATGVRTEFLPAAGQIVLGYRVNQETAFTTIFTWGTDNELYHEAVNIESSGAQLPQFREIELRIQSTGNAVPTGLYLKYEEIEDDLVAKSIGE